MAARLESSGPTEPIPEGPWLNIGCGPYNPPGWVNIDGSWQSRFAAHPLLARVATRLTGRPVGNWPRGIIHRDIRRGLGYAKGTLAVVYSSHTLEHLYRNQALALLREAHAALRPRGVCRVVVPDLASLVRQYVEHSRQTPEERAQPSADQLMRSLMLCPERPSSGWGLLAWYRRRTDLDHHKWMYDTESLLHLFREAGFAAPRSCRFRESDVPSDPLSAVELESRVCNGAGICVEARK